MTHAPRLTFEAPLSARGRNGKVFLAQMATQQVVCKISRTLDFNVRHEAAVLEKLAAAGVANFPKSFGTQRILLDADFRHKANPLYTANESALPPVWADVLLIEYIEGAVDMDKFVYRNKDPAVLMSLVKQVLLAVGQAHERLGFTHYDLHPANVLVQHTDIEKFEYNVFGKKYTVPSCGYRAVIIDFGLSYINDTNPADCALFHTEIGVTSHMARTHTDYKLFLISLSSDLGLTKLDRFVRKMYAGFKIDWETGWDTLSGCNAIDEIGNRCYEQRTACSRVFTEYGHLLLGMVQSLCDFSTTDLPPRTAELRRTYGVLDTEMGKIESKIGSVFYCIYIFHDLVDIAREIRNRPDERVFRERALAVIDSVAQFCTLPDVDWAALLGALYHMADHMSAIIPPYVAAQQREYKPLAKTHADTYARFVSEFPRTIS